MSSFVASGPRQINLAEHSHSSFALIVFLSVCRWGSSAFFDWHQWELSVGDPDRLELCSLLGLTGVGHPTRGTLLGRRVCAYRERQTLPQNSELSFEAIFWASTFVNSNTWHLICNNSNLNFIYGIVCFYVLRLHILASSRIPQCDLGRQTPHLWGGSITNEVEASVAGSFYSLGRERVWQRARMSPSASRQLAGPAGPPARVSPLPWSRCHVGLG
jgi:hypothetical protein